MSRPYEFSVAGTAGSAHYQDGEWRVELGARTTTHRLLRVALARAVGAAPSSVAALAAKILNEAHEETPADA